MMKKLGFILIAIIFLTGCQWSRSSQIGFAAFTVLNIADISQTAYIHSSDEFREVNPIMTQELYIPLMVGLNIGMYYLLDSMPDDIRWTIWIPTAIKGFVVYRNHNLGIGFSLPF